MTSPQFNPEMEQTGSPEERKTNEYFTDDDADIMIRACDGVEFRMHKIILAKAGEVFKDMLSMPQNPSVIDDRDSSDFLDGLPLVELTEDSHTLELLFRSCYPVQHPELKSLDDAYCVLRAAIKYDMEVVAERARKAYIEQTAIDPLRSFAIACTLRWEQEARHAALMCLKEQVWPLEPPLAAEFKNVSFDTGLRLIAYHRHCGRVAHDHALDSVWTNRIFEMSTCTHCLGPFTNLQGLQLRDWFKTYTKAVAAELILQPCGNTATKRAIIDQAIREVFGKTPCDVDMHHIERIRQIVQFFSEELDKVIAEVPLQLDLS